MPVTVTAAASPPVASPTPGSQDAAPEAQAPAATPVPAMAPGAVQPVAAPCGLEATKCCAPANACAEGLRCDSASTVCVALAEEPEDESLPVPVAVPVPTYGIRSSSSVAQPEVGGVGGSPFSAFCPSDQVLIGIRAVADDNLWGIGLNCGRLELSPSGAGYVVSVLPLDEFAVIAGGAVDPPPPLVEYACPPQMVVTALAWTLWQPFVDMQDIVKQVQLTCSELSVSPERQLRTGPTTAVFNAGTAGDLPVSQACGERGAVSGLTGRSGGAIDALSTSCVTLSVEEL
ncbi:MAG: hypothetical protein RL033_3731 [Pseudomonadota bacterium]